MTQPHFSSDLAICCEEARISVYQPCCDWKFSNT